MVVRSSVRRGVATAVILAAIATGCASNDDPPKATPPTPSPTASNEITFSVYGPEKVTDTYGQIAAAYTREHPGTKVHIKAYGTHAEAVAAYRAALVMGNPPDLFLMDHGDLNGLEDDKAIRRVDDLLAKRQVDFGGGYIRTALEAFSDEAALQCMPVDLSPLVVYYNPALIDLERVAEPGRSPVTQENGWSLDEFRRAALQARRPGVRGIYVAPDLEQVAPFVWSGGGEVVDDTDEPTTLTLSDGPSVSAMEKLLEIVRDPALTFDQAALRKRSALARFKAGKLGMILGFRDLVPELREQQALGFDVMPLPKISSGASIAKMSGLCISAGSEHADLAADVLADVISDDGATQLAKTGYVMPTNVSVTGGEDFLQTLLQPLHSGVFSRDVRFTRLLPSDQYWPTVRRATARDLARLYSDPVIAPLQDRLKAIDDASIPMFDPSKTPTQSPTPSESIRP